MASAPRSASRDQMRSDGQDLDSSGFKARYGMSRTDFERLEVLEAMVSPSMSATIRRISFSDSPSIISPPAKVPAASPKIPASGPTIEELSDSDVDDREFERAQSLRDKLYARDVKFQGADSDISFSGAAGEDIETLLERFERVVAQSAPQKRYEFLLSRINNGTMYKRGFIEPEHPGMGITMSIIVAAVGSIVSYQ